MFQPLQESLFYNRISKTYRTAILGIFRLLLLYRERFINKSTSHSMLPPFVVEIPSTPSVHTAYTWTLMHGLHKFLMLLYSCDELQKRHAHTNTHYAREGSCGMTVEIRMSFG